MTLAILYPGLLKEFMFEKNNNLDPYKLKPGSNKKAWWKCPEGHEYLAKIAHRTLSNSGCPYCSGHKLTLERSLAYRNPVLAQEFHPEKNRPLTAKDIHISSRKKIWWRCSSDPAHEWLSTVDNRNKGNGCPYCAGKKTNATNNLATLYPELTKEWYHKLNHDIKPEDVRPHSNKSVYWQCSRKKYHIWKTPIAKRADGGKCPFCCGQKIHINDSALKNLPPAILIEWDQDLNKGINLGKLPTYSKKGIFWKCSKNPLHKPWKASCFSRINGNGNCPTCYPFQTPKTFEESLEFLYPHICKEWHPDNLISPSEIKPGSDKKVKWQCLVKPSHVYFARINQRTRLNTGCPYCNKKPTSPEIRLYAELKYFFPAIKFLHSIKNLEVDIFIPELSLIVEWDSGYYHKAAKSRDINKSKKIINLKHKLIRIRNYKLPTLNLAKCIILTIKEDEVTFSVMRKLMICIANITQDSSLCERIAQYIKNDKFLNVDIYDKLKNQKKGSPSPTRSLAEKYPKIDKIWHPTKNHPITPQELYPFSHEEFWWKCQICNLEWKEKLSDRCTRKDVFSCPSCSRQIVSASYNLEKLFPELIPEVDFEKNPGFDPSQVKPCSNKKIFWKCLKGHSWQARINNRTTNKQGCPYCSGNKLTYEKTLAAICPDAFSAWDRVNNNCSPEEIFANTHQKYFFKCSECNTSFQCRPRKFMLGQKKCKQCKKVENHKQLVKTKKKKPIP